jgi:hypothetical protein
MHNLGLSRPRVYLFEIDSFKYNNQIVELDGPAVSALRRAIAEVKQRWSIIGWVTKNSLSQVPTCFEKALVVGLGCICSR